MVFVDEVREHGNQTAISLDQLYDYYEDTQTAWRLVERYIQAGGRIAITNKPTGTTVNETVLLRKSVGYIEEDLAVSIFKQVMIHLEDFYFGLQRLWLANEPRPLSEMPLTFGDVLKAGSIASLRDELIEKRLRKKSYDSVQDWFKSGEKLMGLGCPNTEEIAQIAEMKASRDVLEHRRGVVDATYRFKAGPKVRYSVDGQRVKIPEPYLRESWLLVKAVTARLTEAATIKVANS